MLEPEDQSMVIPVGAPDEWYQTNKYDNTRNASIVFYGLYTPLQGVPVIAKAARILADRGMTPQFTLIGKGQDYDEVRSLCEGLNNVEFREWVEPEELPQIVASHDIALGIFSNTPKGLHVVPNKVYQSMAAGCAVITSDTPPQRRALGNGVVYVAPNNPQALADAIASLISSPNILARKQSGAAKNAQRFTSDIITRELSQWIKEH